MLMLPLVLQALEIHLNSPPVVGPSFRQEEKALKVSPVAFVKSTRPTPLGTRGLVKKLITITPLPSPDSPVVATKWKGSLAKFTAFCALRTISVPPLTSSKSTVEAVAADADAISKPTIMFALKILNGLMSIDSLMKDGLDGALKEPPHNYAMMVDLCVWFSQGASEKTAAFGLIL